MTGKLDPSEVYELIYDERIPCDDDDTILIKGDATDCESLARRRLNVKVLGKGDSKEKAEDDMHDDLLDAAIADRAKNNIKCSAGTCKGGASCYTTYEIDDRLVKCRKAKRRGLKSIWICTYQGTITHYCICVV